MKNEFIYVLCPTNGYIPQLKMSGPVAHPLKVSKYTAKNMLMSGLKVFEYDKATRRTIELTLQNIKDENKFGPSAEAIANNVAEPVVVTETEGVSASTDNIELPLNPNGTVNENAIVWRKYSSKQKKKIRAQIDEINAAAAEANATPVVEETAAVEEAPITEEPVVENIPEEPVSAE